MGVSVCVCGSLVDGTATRLQVDMLCEHGCDVNGDPTAAESPLQLALRSHRWDAVESLIKHGANPAGIQEDVSFETAPERIRTMLVRAEEEAAGMTKAARG
mmetsp:Transcript_39559/g.92918  ORF Transcript_39559/g.92918 Transcript_39559/m.92918 type:complete len:101 (-) Transcript_39559:83-385(-)